MATDTVVIQPKRTVATLVVTAGEGPTLVKNLDLTNIVYLGDTDSIKATDAQGVIPLYPNESFTVDGQRDLFAVNNNATAVTILTLSGGLTNFLGLTQGMGALAIASIFSPNFITGVSGWSINQNGNAEFNNLTIRGTFFGLDFELNSNGLFFYSGVPANGNLFMYWATADGTDEFGNTFFTGLFIGNPTVGPQVSLIQSSGHARINFPVFPTAFFSQIANISALNQSSSAQLFISGAALAQAGFTDWVQAALWAFEGASPAHFDLNYVDANAVPHNYFSLSNFGVDLNTTRSIGGVHPGTGTSNTNPAIGEQWQTPALINNWQAGGPIPGGIRYRQTPELGGSIFIEGDIFNNTLVPPVDSTAAVFAAAYVTALGGKTRNIACMYNIHFANNSPSAPWIFIDGSGNIRVTSNELNNTEIAFQGYIPLT